MFVLKACPRCQGDLYVNSDGDRSCIQCGYDPGPFSDAMALRRAGIASAYLSAMKRHARTWSGGARVSVTGK